MSGSAHNPANGRAFSNISRYNLCCFIRRSSVGSRHKPLTQQSTSPHPGEHSIPKKSCRLTMHAASQGSTILCAILLGEDELEVRRCVAMALQGQGYSIESAPAGEE